MSKHNKEDLSADMTKNVCRDDVQLPRLHKHDSSRFLWTACEHMSRHSRVGDSFVFLDELLFRKSLSLSGFSQTVLLIIGTIFVSPRHQCWANMWYLCRRLDLNNQPLPPDCDSVAVVHQCQQFSLPYSATDCKYHPRGNTPSSPCRCQEECKYRLRGSPQL